MIAALLITLRETLEAALIVGIILAYLNKTKNPQHKKSVWLGVTAGIGLSLILAYFFQTYLGGFTGRAEEIYEGIAMLIAAALLTWMILWMLKQRKNLKKNLEKQTEHHLKSNHGLGLMMLAFVGVAREGIETVIFLQAAFLQSENSHTLLGAGLGIILAIALAIALFKKMRKVKLRRFFTITSILLILFAAGLFAHGIHELQEAHIIPIVIEQVWDTNSILNEKGALGGILKGLFGYNGNPSLLEVMGYIIYLILIKITWKRLDKR